MPLDAFAPYLKSFSGINVGACSARPTLLGRTITTPEPPLLRSSEKPVCFPGRPLDGGRQVTTNACQKPKQGANYRCKKFNKLQTVKANVGLKKHYNKNSSNTGIKCGKTQTEQKCKQRMHHNQTDYAKSALDCFETHSRFFKRGYSGRGERPIADGFPACSLQQLERHDRPQSLRRPVILRQRPRSRRIHHYPIMGKGQCLGPLVISCRRPNDHIPGIDNGTIREQD
jgi:hypothetical protein